MDIIDSFINKNNKYEFIPLYGDASKKKFFEIKNNDKLLLLKITIEPGLYDEQFDQIKCDNSQYDYFKYSLEFLKNINNVPRVIASNNDLGIILMERVGNLRLKEYLDENIACTKYIYQAIDWLVRLNELSKIVDNKIMERKYGKNAMEKEIQMFIKWGLKYANNYDVLIFMQGINSLLSKLEPTELVYNHRDYQLRNIMVYNDQIYIIDTQDICIGPNYCDIATLLFNPNIIFTMEEKKSFAKYFHKNAKIQEPFEEFFLKISYYGLIRILKSYGRHCMYYIRDGRQPSMEMIEINRKLLNQMSTILEPNYIFDIINKYSIIPIILCAGKGSRMNNNKIPKPLCEINGKPMLFYILDNVVKLNPYQIIIVVGHQKEMIISKLKEYPYQNIIFVNQDEQLGTGHAVMQCQQTLQIFNGQLLILFGDKPLTSIRTLEKLAFDFFSKKWDAALVTYVGDTSWQQPGRIIRNSEGNIIEVYEDANKNYPANEFAGGIQMYNSVKLFNSIYQIENNNSKQEYYLADVIKIMYEKNYRIGTTIVEDKTELLNVNTKSDLENAIKILKHDIL